MSDEESSHSPEAFNADLDLNLESVLIYLLILQL